MQYYRVYSTLRCGHERDFPGRYTANEATGLEYDWLGECRYCRVCHESRAIMSYRRVELKRKPYQLSLNI